MVADALEEACDEEQLRRTLLARALFRDEVRQRVERVLKHIVHLLVHLADLIGLLHAPVAIGLDRAAHHGGGAIAELLDPALAVGIERLLDRSGCLRDIEGVIADALDIRRDLEARRDDAQVMRDWLLLGNQEDALVLDVDDHVVDGVVGLHDLLRKDGIVLEKRLHRLLDVCKGLVAHRGDELLHDLEVVDVFLSCLAFHISRTSL